MPRWRGIGIWRMVPCMEVYKLSQLEAQYQDEICWIHSWRLFPSGCTYIWMGPAVILMQDSKFFLSFLFLRNKTSQVDRKRKMHLELNLTNFLTNSSKIDDHLETTSSRRLSLHRASYFFDFFSFLSFLFAQTWLKHNVFLKLSIMLPISITCMVFDKHGDFL